MSKLTDILQNENGHIAIFEAAIPSGAVSLSLSLKMHSLNINQKIGQTKPGKCQYDYGFKDPSLNSSQQAQTYMSTVSAYVASIDLKVNKLSFPSHRIEVGSMAYLTGLAQSMETATGLGTVMGIISVESKAGFLLDTNYIA